MRKNFIAFVAATVALAGAATAAATGSEVSTLHLFGAVPNDGAYPSADLVADANGALYGTTQGGGYAGGGTVYKLARDGTYTLLHSFAGGSDGATPLDRVLLDGAGNIYGTTVNGGAYQGGVVFKLTPTGQERVLYSFGGTTADATSPFSDLIVGVDGALYGTTGYGGAFGFGTVFRITKSGHETVLYSFRGKSDGNYPDAGLVTDTQGNLFSVTYSGGDGAGHAGTAFELTRAGKLIVLHAFANGADGAYPESAMIRDAAGNLYGAAAQSSAYGVVYKLTPSGTETILHEFTGPDGNFPLARVLLDKSGSIFGTTAGGGTDNEGVVFKLAPDGTFTKLYVFTRYSQSIEPRAGLIEDAAGNLYGTTSGGYISPGSVFRLSP